MTVHSCSLLSVQRSRWWMSLLILASLLGGSASLEAARPHQALKGVAEQLFGRDGAQPLRIELPVIDGQLATVELEPFTVWRENARIVVHGASGQERLLVPPSTRLYRGRIVGADDSAVFFAVDPSGDASGMIAVGDRLFEVGRGVAPLRAPTLERARAADAPLLVREFDTNDELLRGVKPFFCAADDFPAANVRDHDDGWVPRAPKRELNGAPVAA